MKKSNVLKMGVIFALVCAIGFMVYYFFFRPTIHFIDNNTMEINTKFDPAHYVQSLEDGKKSDVTCNTKKLKANRLGKYTVTYHNSGRDYDYTIQVVDTKKPKILGVEDKTCLLNSKVDLKAGVTVEDNSKEKIAVKIDDSQLDSSKEGTYEVTYTAKDSSGNKTKAVRQIKIVKEIGRREQSNEKVVYLTFDDGPSNNTIEILKILKKYNAKATFFVTGTGGRQYDYLIKQEYEEGHTIGLHTYSHNYGKIYKSTDAYFQDLDEIGQLVKKQIGFVPHYIRFPGGGSNTVSRRYCPGIMTTLSKEVVNRGYQYYDWNADSTDASGSNVPVSKLIANGTSSKDNNIMILCHDTFGKQTTVQALPSIIEYYQKLGYTFKGIDDDTFVPKQKVNN